MKHRKDTYTSKILIQQLHVAMNDLQGDQLVVLVFDGTAEIQTSVSMACKHIEKCICEANFIKQALRIDVFSMTASSHARNKTLTVRAVMGK